MKMYLGVVDVGYTDDNGATTTGDVAGYLEDRYHVMRTFLEVKEGEIHNIITDQVAGAIESIAQGKRVPKLDLQPAGEKIQDMFRGWLDSGEMNREILPQSQQVSSDTLKTSSRKKVIKTEKQRQAFIDTGLYQASFRVWFAT